MYTIVGSTNVSVSKSQRGCSAYRIVTPAPNAAPIVPLPPHAPRGGGTAAAAVTGRRPAR